MAESIPRPDYPATPYGATAVPARRSSWGAIFAGMFVALVVNLTLNLLGLAVGLSASYGGGAGGGTSLGVGIWFTIATIISLFIGGLVAGRMTNLRSVEGMFQGLVVWGLATFTVLLFAGGIVPLVNQEGGAARHALFQPTWLSQNYGYAGNQPQQAQPVQPNAQQPANASESGGNPITQATRANEHVGLPLIGAAWWGFGALFAGGIAAALGGWLGAPRGDSYYRMEGAGPGTTIRAP